MFIVATRYQQCYIMEWNVKETLNSGLQRNNFLSQFIHRFHLHFVNKQNKMNKKILQIFAYPHTGSG